jgi:hypothetical protein
LPSEEQRVALGRELGKRLQVDYDAVSAARYFNIMTDDEIRDAAAQGIDIQLHTHRHRCPEDRRIVSQEVADNRAYLSRLVPGPLTHFCYPSGLWCEDHLGWLRAEGIQSATTCDPGLNSPSTPRHALRRFLDAETLSDIEFEAEMTGYGEILRAVRSRLVWIARRLLPSRTAGRLDTGGRSAVRKAE